MSMSTGADTIERLDPYQVLGVSHTDSDEAIRKRYLRLVMQFHPDRHRANGREKEMSDRLAIINNSYDEIKKIREHHPEVSQSKSTGKADGKPKNQDSGFRFSDFFYDMGFNEGWAAHADWSGLMEATRIAYEAKAQINDIAKQAVKSTYSSLEPSSYTFQEVQRIIADNLGSYMFRARSFILDPISLFVAEISDKNKKEVAYSSGPYFRFGGHRPSFMTGVKCLGPDPNTREIYQHLFKDPYFIKQTVEESSYTIMAMTAFIYSHYYRLTYIPKEAASQVDSKFLKEGWGKSSGLTMLAMALPFIQQTSMRNELLLRVLDNAGNAEEFVQVSTLYLYEVMVQMRLYPEDKRVITLQQAWSNLQRSIQSRGTELGATTTFDFLASLQTMAKKNNPFFTITAGNDRVPSLDFFDRQLSKLSIYEEVSQIILDNFRSDIIKDLKYQLQTEPQKRLILRARANKLPEPIRTEAIQIIINPHGSCDLVLSLAGTANAVSLRS